MMMIIVAAAEAAAAAAAAAPAAYPPPAVDSQRSDGSGKNGKSGIGGRYGCATAPIEKKLQQASAEGCRLPLWLY